VSAADPAITLLESRTRWTSARFSLHETTFATPDGPVTRPIIRHPGAVAVIAQPDPRSIVLVRQYRYAIARWTLEIPAGTRVPGEHPAATAHRELREEVGLTARRLHELGRFFPACGVSDEEMILYRAEGLDDVAAAPEHGELASRVIVALDELPVLFADGSLSDAKTIIAAQLLGITLIRPHP
jgi:ADP-ribose pyrophosphatase